VQEVSSCCHSTPLVSSTAPQASELSRGGTGSLSLVRVAVLLIMTSNCHKMNDKSRKPRSDVNPCT
jgi:hypothetical protein